MKLVALLGGVLAGMYALSASLLLGGDLQPQFQALWSAANSQLARALWYTPPAVALIGGLLAPLVPAIAALALLAASIGWLLIGLSLTAGLDHQLVVPLALTVTAAISAFLAGEAELRNRRRQRRERQAEFKALDDEAAAREAALRLEPQFLVGAPASKGSRVSGLPLKLREAAEEAADEPASEIGFAYESEIEERQYESPPQPGNRLLLTLVSLNVVAVVALTVAITWLLLQTTGGASLLQPGGASAADPLDATPARLVAAESTPSTPRADSVSYADPFSYCASVETIDFPDRRYAGPRLPPTMAIALGVPQSSAPDRVSWRCLDGEVLACQSFDWPACGITPTVTEMIAFCSVQPEVERLFAPNGTWSCTAGKPVLPEDASWPVDERGYFPPAWKIIRAESGEATTLVYGPPG